MGSKVFPNATSEEGTIPKEGTIPTARKENVTKFCGFVWVCLFFLIVIGSVFIDKTENEYRKHKLDVTIQSMDFTVLNVTETRLRVNWDVLILIPERVLGDYMCLNGNIQVFILYKGATIATSSPKSYSNLKPLWAQQFNVSMIASEGDMDGGTMKEIMEVIKNKGEIRFGSRLVVPDCRRGTSGKMKYECDEATLRFGSRRDATLFGNYPICHYVH